MCVHACMDACMRMCLVCTRVFAHVCVWVRALASAHLWTSIYFHSQRGKKVKDTLNIELRDNCSNCYWQEEKQHSHSESTKYCDASFSLRWHRTPRKGPYALRPVSQQSPQGCPRNSANICLVEHRSFSAMEGGMSAASFLHSFPSGGHCCDALACSCSEISSSLWVPLPCQAADQMWYLLCLPVNCRPDVISAVLASLSALSFSLTPACPGQ